VHTYTVIKKRTCFFTAGPFFIRRKLLGAYALRKAFHGGKFHFAIIATMSAYYVAIFIIDHGRYGTDVKA